MLQEKEYQKVPEVQAHPGKITPKAVHAVEVVRVEGEK